MIELRWTTKKTGLVLQYRYGRDDRWTEWTDVTDTDGNYPPIWVQAGSDYK